MHLLGRAVHKRTKRSTGRARSDLSSTDSSLLTANFLLNGLLEPSLDSASPVLAKVLVRND